MVGKPGVEAAAQGACGAVRVARLISLRQSVGAVHERITPEEVVSFSLVPHR